MGGGRKLEFISLRETIDYASLDVHVILDDSTYLRDKLGYFDVDVFPIKMQQVVFWTNWGHHLVGGSTCP